MPAMPKAYSTELVTLIKAMLNHNPDKRPSVNRILRDPYIKKNIAIFLEGTKKRYVIVMKPCTVGSLIISAAVIESWCLIHIKLKF